MIVNSYQISDSLHLIPISNEQSIDLNKSNKERLWIDLKDFEKEELKSWIDKLEIKALTKEILNKGDIRTGFYPFNSELLIIIPVISETGIESALTIICRENLLLTIHKDGILYLNPRDLEQESSEYWLYGASTSALLSAIFMDLSFEISNKVNDLKETIALMEKRMETNPNSLELDEIMRARGEQLFLESVILGQSPCIAGLKIVEKPFFKLSDAKDYLNCSEVNLLASRNLLDRLENRILDLRSSVQMHNQEVGNRKLNMLSIVSAIFLPATFLVGFWGMNFINIPMIDSPYGLAIACAIMALITTGIVVYMYKNEWFNE